MVYGKGRPSPSSRPGAIAQKGKARSSSKGSSKGGGARPVWHQHLRDAIAAEDRLEAEDVAVVGPTAQEFADMHEDSVALESCKWRKAVTTAN